jgi:transglutaminase-like putative cysteine protease
VPVETASSDLLGVVEGRDEFEFYYYAKMPAIKDSAKVWIPIAQSDEYQDIEVISMQIPGNHKFLEENVFNNKILYIELGPEQSSEELEIKYRVQRKEKGPYEAIQPIDQIYLEPNILMPIGGQFSEIANEVIKGKENDSKLIQARALYDYIIDNMRYMKFGDYGRGDAVYACDSKTGNCTEFHSFFISLARSIGIPARFSIQFVQ